MKPIIAVRTIHAPSDFVFRTISDINGFRKAVPHIVKVEFLSTQQHGIGTRFRETRLMKGREHSVELEVTEFVENDRVRMKSDAGGAIWDTLFTVSQVGGDVEVKMQMDIRPHNILARIMVVLIRGMVAKDVVSDLDAIKSYCEANGNLAMSQ